MLNVDLTLRGWGLKLLTFKNVTVLDKLFTLFLELKNHYKYVLNSPQYISGFQMLTPCHSQQGIIIIRLQSFSQFRVIITIFEMINEPRLKTEPCLCYVLFIFFFVFEIYIKKKFIIRWSFYNR